MTAAWVLVKPGNWCTDDFICEATKREGITRDQPPYWVLSVHSQYVQSTASSKPRARHFRTLADVKAYVEANK